MKQLAVRLARGEEAAFVELYDACADRLLRYLSLRLGSRHLAEDVLQTAMLQVVRNRRRFANVDNPIAYLFQIARHEAARLVERRSRQVLPDASPTDPLRQLAHDTTSQREDTEVVAMALARLTADDRELIELKVYAGLTFREIAAVIGRPQASVATRYRRTFESMRPWLETQFKE